MQARKNKELIQCFTWAGRWSVQTLPGKLGSAHAVTPWEYNGHHSKCPLFLLLLYPSFYCWAWGHMTENVLLANSGQLSWVCLLPTPHAPQAPCWQGNIRNTKDLDSMHSSATTNIITAITTIFTQYPNPSIIQASSKKICSIPAKTTTLNFFKIPIAAFILLG